MLHNRPVKTVVLDVVEANWLAEDVVERILLALFDVVVAELVNVSIHEKYVFVRKE